MSRVTGVTVNRATFGRVRNCDCERASIARVLAQNSREANVTFRYDPVMAFGVEVGADRLELRLTGRDRFMSFRDALLIPLADVRSVALRTRAELESLIRTPRNAQGRGEIKRRVGRRRVGSTEMTCVAGSYWAVEDGADDDELLVVELRQGPYRWLIIEVPDCAGLAAQMEQQLA